MRHVAFAGEDRGRGRGRAPAGRAGPAARAVVALASALAILLAGTAATAPKESRDSTRVHRRVPKRAVRYEFAGIPWLTPADSAVQVLEAHGWGPVRVHEPGRPLDSMRFEVGRRGGEVPNTLTGEGTLFGRWAVLFGTLDDRRRVLRWEIVIPAGREEEPYAPMRKLYDDIGEELRAKYGTPSAVSDAFQFPFRKGDGREASALEQGLAEIRTEWASRRADRVSIELSRDLSMILRYVSRDWTDLDRQRRRKNAKDL